MFPEANNISYYSPQFYPCLANLPQFIPYPPTISWCLILYFSPYKPFVNTLIYHMNALEELEYAC